MTRTLAAAIFALLTITAPAHAAVLDLTDSVNLNYLNDGNLTGTVTFTEGFPPTYYFISGDLSLNGTQLIQVPTGPNLAIFVDPAPPTGPIFFSLPADFPNLTPFDFGAISGTVTILSENVSPTPLPAALPLFGAALAGLGGVGWIRKKAGKVSA